jgi:hypothetical protein
MNDKLSKLRELIVRLGDIHSDHNTSPDDSDIGLFHEVRETWTGYLPTAPRRVLRYAGNGRWEVFPGTKTYTLWREDGGSVHDWRDVSESLRERALILLDSLL